MKISILIGFILLLFSYSYNGNIIDLTDNRKIILSMWQDYKIHHSLSFESEEDEARMEIYQQNVLLIHRVNSQNKGYKLSENKFTHFTKEEMKEMRGVKHVVKGVNYIPSGVQSYVNWTEKGAVTKVKNQKNCGSCWAFSTTGALEGAHYVAKGELLDFSEQELVDCSTKYDNHGCEGGYMSNAFQYVIEHGIEVQTDYPYTNKDAKCQSIKSKEMNIISSYVNVTTGDEKKLSEALYKTPIAVAIDASSIFFQLYQSGVIYIDGCSSTELNHGVLLVGQGTSKAGEDYYLVKNSWGSTWGMNGYIMMARNRDNNCGIASYASYAIGS